jgi:hypothetical protein
VGKTVKDMSKRLLNHPITWTPDQIVVPEMSKRFDPEACFMVKYGLREDQFHVCFESGESVAGANPALTAVRNV